MYLSDQEIIRRINRLRQERNAVILAHNYQFGEVQDIADFNGDSLELSIKAANCDAGVIVFCGVSFMAETAYILSPDKTVLLPVPGAGCEMADMITGEELRAMKAEHPGAMVACYVNSTAEIKAESDICVTSANAADMIRSLPEDREIIFVPDRNLGSYCQKVTGRKMILWDGCCPIHNKISPETVLRRRQEFPEAEVLMHPEASPEALELADRALSTGGMCRYAKTTDRKQFIVATEIGIIHRLQRENPEKQFIPVSEQTICNTMKMTKLTDVLESLEKMQYKVTVPEEIRVRAKRPVDRMLEETAKLKSLS